MENVAAILVGILLLVLGYLIGVREKIGFVHSYHYKRVAEADKQSFCRGVGLGNILIGMGIIPNPLINAMLGETAALWTAGSFVLTGLVAALATIIKYNKGLF